MSLPASASAKIDVSVVSRNFDTKDSLLDGMRDATLDRCCVDLRLINLTVSRRGIDLRSRELGWLFGSELPTTSVSCRERPVQFLLKGGGKSEHAIIPVRCLFIIIAS